MKILIVEDEIALADVLKKALEEESFSADVANDGESGLFRAETEEYDAIVLDLMLPKMDGWEFLKRLRRTRATPVVVLTARDTVQDKVKGLGIGADDYLTKPFALEELMARVRAVIRRSAGSPSPLIAMGDLEVDTARASVKRQGEHLTLTAKEYALLEFLVFNRGRLVTRTEIYEHIYDETDDTLSNVVDVHLSNLRKKVGPGVIQTRRGQGYIIDA